MRANATAYAPVEYPTLVSDLRPGFAVRLPLFPGRIVKVEKVYTIGQNWFVRFSNGNMGGTYKPNFVFTVVSDN